MRTLYDVLKPIEKELKEAYKFGAKIPMQIFRDLEIYEEYQKMNTPRMDRYLDLSVRYNIHERHIMRIIQNMMFSFEGKK